MRIEAVTEATAELRDALARLLPQLNPNLPPPDAERLERLVADPDVVLLVAREDGPAGHIVGTTTVIVYTTPFWIKARLDEVVVDGSARGKGAGEALVRAALDVARRRGAQIAELQSARTDSRQAAHRLYERLGFKVRDSDVFRISLG
jgi:GNAT superfamily N-acetyltransferase